jgi:hypothetical protein
MLSRLLWHLIQGSGVWRSLVARFVRDEEAVGSNPATPTIGVNEHGASVGPTVEAPIVWLAVG